MNPANIEAHRDAIEKCIKNARRVADLNDLPVAVKRLIAKTVNIHTGRRKAVNRSMVGKIIRQIQLYLLWNSNDKKCYICSQHVPFNAVTRDHVFPRSHGYPLARNAMPSHSHCNLEKGNRIPTRREIETACIAYENMDQVFDPALPHHTDRSINSDWIMAFKTIGMEWFSGLSYQPE